MNNTTVRHFGPSADLPGGMAAVLESYRELPLAPWSVELVATWHPTAPLYSIGPASSAGARLLIDRFSRTRRPSVVHVHLSAGGSFVREGALLLLAARLGVPVVASLHGSSFPTFAAAHPSVVARVLRAADAICALGPSGADLARTVVAGSSTRVVVVPNPVKVPASTTPASATDEVVLFAGEVGTRKGVDTLLEAWSTVHTHRPGARLVVAGPTAGDFQLDLPRGVEYLGAVPRPRIHRLLEVARVAVLPSRAEQMPMFILEAMARARPVVATDVAEVAWTVGDGGRIVPVASPPALAEALIQLLSDSSEAERTGLRSRARIEAMFSESASATHLVQLYDSLTHPPPDDRRCPDA